MSKVVLLTILIIALGASVASADVIGVFTDANGYSCQLAPGFTTTATVMHKFTTGSVGSNFKLILPAGSVLFAFQTVFNQPVPIDQGNISVQYGQCLTGHIAIGFIVAVLQVGVIHVAPSDNGIGYVESITCSGASRFVYPATAGVGTIEGCYQPLATEATTWGSVKALYR